MVNTLIRRRREEFSPNLLPNQKLLHDYYLHMKEDLRNICLGLEYCITCEGHNCAIGQSKEIVEAALDNQEWQTGTHEAGESHWDKPFTEEEVLDCLGIPFG